MHFENHSFIVSARRPFAMSMNYFTRMNRFCEAIAIAVVGMICYQNPGPVLPIVLFAMSTASEILEANAQLL